MGDKPNDEAKEAPRTCPACGEVSPNFMTTTRLHRGDCALVSDAEACDKPEWIDVEQRGLPRRGPRYLDVRCQAGHVHRVEWGPVGYFAINPDRRLHAPDEIIEVKAWRRVKVTTNNRS
jgi:hypothetical protein